MSDTPQLLVPREAAAMLRKPVRTLANWRYLGYGPRYLHVGRDVRYRLTDIEAWLDGHAHGGPDAPAA